MLVGFAAMLPAEKISNSVVAAIFDKLISGSSLMGVCCRLGQHCRQLPSADAIVWLSERKSELLIRNYLGIFVTKYTWKK